MQIHIWKESVAPGLRITSENVPRKRSWWTVEEQRKSPWDGMDHGKAREEET